MHAVNELIVRHAQPTQLERVYEAYAAAFTDEAVAAWAMPNASPSIFRDMLAGAIETDEVLIAQRDDELVGVSVWMTVHSAERIYREAAELSELTAAHPELARTAIAMQMVAARHPDPPHLFLSSMGVVPAARGQGVGGAMLRHRLARVDSEQQAAYLEASTERNQKLYAKHGFRPLGAPIDLPESGPRIQPMWRDPSPAN